MQCRLWGGSPEGHYTSEVGDVQAAEESLPDAIVERSVLDQLLPQDAL